MAYIEIKNLSFAYPEAKNVLNNISLSFEQGEFVVLCGASGSGKSTLLSLLKKELSPKGTLTGTITMPEGIIGFVAQSPDRQIVTDQVWHELAFGLENLSLNQKEMQTRVSEMAACFGMEEWFHEQTDTLSGGQKQLLNLASVLVMHPSVLLLDEPTAQLDPIAANRLLQILKQVNEEWGTTILLVEHRLEESIPMCDRLVVLKDGAILAEGTPDALYEALSIEGLSECFPVSMQVAARLGERRQLPLTVKEGKRYLDQHIDKTKVKPLVLLAKEQGEREKTGTVALSGKDLWFSYDRHATPVIRGLSLEVHYGEIVGILGGNGSGKSTLATVLAGGRRVMRGKVVAREKVALLPQNSAALFLETSIQEEYQAYAKQCCQSDQEAEERILEILEQLPVAPFFDRNPLDLSGGELALCALGKLLIGKPRCIILDEPTKGMDVSLKQMVSDLLERLALEGCAIVFVTHDTTFAAKTADQCGLFFDGNLSHFADVHTFFQEHYFYTTPANRLGREYVPNCITVTELCDCLEDAYA